jgi:hypothetical protein
MALLGHCYSYYYSEWRIPPISGSITDKVSGKRLPGVTVMINQLNAHTTTNKHGEFRFDSQSTPLTFFPFFDDKPKHKKLEVIFRHPEYNLQKTDFDVVICGRTPADLVDIAIPETKLTKIK